MFPATAKIFHVSKKKKRKKSQIVRHPGVTVFCCARLCIFIILTADSCFTWQRYMCLRCMLPRRFLAEASAAAATGLDWVVFVSS